MLVIEKAMKAVVARNYHNMVMLGAGKNIRSGNTVYTVKILYTVYTTLHGYSNLVLSKYVAVTTSFGGEPYSR